MEGVLGKPGRNPVEVITHSTGDWTLIFLLVTLSVMPLRRLTDQLWLIRFRRMFGLFSFFYVTLHFLTYIWLDKFFNAHEMLVDIAKAKSYYRWVHRLCVADSSGLYFDVGLDSSAGWPPVEPSASTDLSGCDCGVIHYYWLVKADVRKPLQYAVVLGYRLVISVFRNPRQTTMRHSAPPRASL